MYMLRSVWLFLGLLLAFSTQLLAQTEYKYSYVPKTVYKNQVFPVTIVVIDSPTSLVPTFTFNTTSSIKPLFKKPLVIRNGNDSFYTFYFKAKDQDVRIPSVTISTPGTEVAFSDQTIFVKSLQKSQYFSGVLAADMKIKNSQVSNYDEANYIVSLDIEAYEANLEDIALEHTIESGVENIKRYFAKVKAEFYVVIPIDKKVLKLSYFNTIKKQFVTISIPVIVQDASVSTQSALNPKEDNFEKLKRYALMGLSGFFLLMFLFKRDFFYLVFTVISIITLLALYVPHKKICISEGSALYILPMSTSTISTKIDATIETPLLGERGEYKKIEYKKGIIGWVKNENICHD